MGHLDIFRSKLGVDDHNFTRLVRILNHCMVNYPYTRERRDGYETHHIIPRSWGGGDEYSNLVYIPHRMHFIIHRLMANAFPLDRSMVTAFYLMTNVKKGKVNSRTYTKLRDNYIEHLKRAYETGDLISSFSGNVPVVDNRGQCVLMPKTEYDKTSENYRHVTKGQKRPLDEIEFIKDSFRTGKRVSSRKGRVMVRNIASGVTALIDKTAFIENDEYEAVSKGNTITEEHRQKISLFVSGMDKTDVQKSSASRLMRDLCKNIIICGCCNREFNVGNYHKHITGISTKGRTVKDDQKHKQRSTISKRNTELGTVKSIYSIQYVGKQYIVYDIKIAAKALGVSLPTFRKKTQPKKVGSHRGRNIIKIYTDIEIEEFSVFEDEIGQ